MPVPKIAKSEAEKELIVAAIVRAQTIAKEEAAAAHELEFLRQRAQLESDRYPDYLLKARQVQALQNKKFEVYNEAIQRTITTYHLRPPQLDLSAAVGSPQQWEVKSWSPHYSENEIADEPGKWRKRTKDELMAEELRNSFDIDDDHIRGTAHAAATNRIGEISLYGNLFADPNDPDNPTKTNDPDTIALVIFHETAHWVDTSATVGRRHSDQPAMAFRSEEQAYQEQAKFAQILGRSDVAKWAEKVSKQYGQQAVLAAAEKLDWRTIRVRHPDWLSADAASAHGSALSSDSDDLNPEPHRVSGDLAFLESTRHLPDISQRARDIFALQEAQNPDYVAYRAALEKIRQEESVRYAEEDARITNELDTQAREIREHFENMEKNWEYLKTVTGLACSNPDELQRLAQNGEVPGASISDVDFDWEMKQTEVINSKTRPAINPCQRYILEILQHSTTLIPSTRVLSLARSYRSQNPTMVRRFTTAVSDFFGVLKQLPNSFGNTSGNERSLPEGNPGSRHSPDNWESLNQLRGMAGS